MNNVPILHLIICAFLVIYGLRGLIRTRYMRTYYEKIDFARYAVLMLISGAYLATSLLSVTVVFIGLIIYMYLSRMRFKHEMEDKSK
ncbi:MAG: hypothetical protein DUD32_08975 [Lactobacillus sp.]|nr:hypothetical protein [Paucilactobacillus vaccinostercus]RRG09248.1 MAG: hypothetical protein DUD32_08975 [Lactobacillus sp.]